jgi:hypothetical protein
LFTKYKQSLFLKDCGPPLKIETYISNSKFLICRGN